MPYTVKAFKDFDQLVENCYESFNQAEERFNQLKGDHDAVYVYDPNGEIVKSYSDTYDGWEPNQATCGYCGGTCLDGYCWQSPDGSHHENYDF